VGSMFDKLEEVEQRYRALDITLSDPHVFDDRIRYQNLTAERAKISLVVESYQRYKYVLQQLEDNKKLLTDQDEDIKELAHNEIATLMEEKTLLEQRLQLMLLPKDHRFKILKGMRDSAVANGMKFGACREGLTELNTASCDGSWLMPQAKEGKQCKLE